MSADADAVHRKDRPVRDIGSHHWETGDHIRVVSVNLDEARPALLHFARQERDDTIEGIEAKRFGNRRAQV